MSDEKPEIVIDFEEFDKANPRVWHLFEHFSLQAVANGRSKLSAAFIIERIRWEIMLETKGSDWKINNDFRAGYARKFMRQYPNLRGVFGTRHSVFDEVVA